MDIAEPDPVSSVGVAVVVDEGVLEVFDSDFPGLPHESLGEEARDQLLVEVVGPPVSLNLAHYGVNDWKSGFAVFPGVDEFGVVLPAVSEFVDWVVGDLTEVVGV